MSATVYAMQDDTVELICYRHYGYTAGITETVLANNPGLAAHGPVLPMGTAVLLPKIETQQKQTIINLWD
jgi:phage tail protein X